MTEVLQIDRIACDGHGACAELLPELIALDDWGYPIVVSSTVPGALIEHARRAVEACPVLALKLRALAVTSGREQRRSGRGPRDARPELTSAADQHHETKVRVAFEIDG